MTNEDIAVQLAEHGKEIGSLKHRVDEVEELTHAVNEVAIGVREVVVNLSNVNKRIERAENTANDRMKSFENSLRSQGERIGELEKKPAKKWDSLSGTIVAAIASGIVGYMLSSLF